MYILLIFISIIFSFSYLIQFISAEEIVTIIPGSSDSSQYRFFDITEYLLKTGEQIKWFNADDIVHNLIILSDDKKTTITKSADIQPGRFFSYKFNKEGDYIFQSSKYPWMEGKIIVTNSINTLQENMENNINIVVSWTPAFPKIKDNVFFKIIFIDNNTGKNYEHIDYSFTIKNPVTKETLYKNPITHSAWGVEPGSYQFKSTGIFVSNVEISGILFQPVEPDSIEYKIHVNALNSTVSGN